MAVEAVVVGSLVMDLSFAVPRRPEAGEVAIATDFGTYRGGKGYNQAVALARLGARVTFIGAVGADAHGDAFLAALADEGIDAGRVLQLRGAVTGVAVPMVTPDGDVAFVQYPGANRELAVGHVADLPDADLLLLQGEVSAATSLRAGRTFRNRGATVLLNPAPVHDITNELLDCATVICPNQPEARALLAGTADAAPEHDEDLAAALATTDRVTVVTLGAAGAAYAGRGEHGLLRPPHVTAIDATGAGDAFCAALGLALARGDTLPNAVHYANAAGALATTRPGAEPGLPTARDLTALLSEQPR